MDAELIMLGEMSWEPFGGSTKGIFRKPLSKATFPSGSKAALVLAKPGGEFPEHVDAYSHIFYILEGEAELSVAGEKACAGPGTALTVMAGKKHGYRNSGQGDLLLITLNIF
jgi:quercetin dioxygenase-like cupin family protein